MAHDVYAEIPILENDNFLLRRIDDKADAEDLLKAVKDTMPKKGKDVVVIMHDTYGKQHTVDALPSIIEYFQSINYEFKSFKKE